MRTFPQPELPVTATAATATALHGFENEILRFGRDASRIFDLIAADPTCLLARAYGALAHVLGQSRSGLAMARQLLHEQDVRGVTPREARLVAAIDAWSREDVGRARQTLERLVADLPEDLFAARLLQLLQFNAGDAIAMRATIEHVLPVHVGTAEAHAMHAFALAETGALAAAERAARHALALGPEPWAHHALSHVMYVEGRHREGRAWMHAHAGDWARCSSFLFTHNWWHAALFDLELAAADSALDLYDRRVWSMRKDHAQDQINAVSLLARLELSGIDVGDRWHEIAAHVAPRCGDAVDGFLDLHLAWALARAGDDGAVTTLLRRARAGNVAEAPRWRRIMPAAAGGIVAFARGAHEQAWWLLGPVLPQLRLLGGSTVQRDLFERVAVAARAGVELAA
jgi:tetratricopeptide (TPR) repeat protein